MSVDGRGDRAALAGVLLLALLHFLLHPYLLSWWWGPDLAAGALLIGALRLQAGRAAILGFVLGLLEGAMALTGLGPLAVAYALVGYLAGRSWRVVFADVRLFLPAYLFTGAWLLVVLRQLIAVGDLVWSFMVLRAPVAALLTAIVAGAVEVAEDAVRG